MNNNHSLNSGYIHTIAFIAFDKVFTNILYNKMSDSVRKTPYSGGKLPPAMIPDHKEIFVDPSRRITRLQTKPGTDPTETFSQPRKKYTRYKKYTTTEKSHGRIGGRRRQSEK